MKNYYLFFILLLVTLTAKAQIVDIPDTNFKNALLNHDPIIDINNDGEIQESEAESVTVLRMVNNECFAPFSLICWVSFGNDKRKVIPPDQLIAFLAVRYEAYECTFKIMSD